MKKWATVLHIVLTANHRMAGLCAPVSYSLFNMFVANKIMIYGMTL